MSSTVNRRTNICWISLSSFHFSIHFQQNITLKALEAPENRQFVDDFEVKEHGSLDRFNGSLLVSNSLDKYEGNLMTEFDGTFKFTMYWECACDKTWANTGFVEFNHTKAYVIINNDWNCYKIHNLTDLMI